MFTRSNSRKFWILNDSFLRLVTTHFNCRLNDGFSPAGHLKSQVLPVHATVTPSLMFNALLFFGSPRKLFQFRSYFIQRSIWGWKRSKNEFLTAIIRDFLFARSSCWSCCGCSNSCCGNCCMKLASIESFWIDILTNPINVWRGSCVNTIKTLWNRLFLTSKNKKMNLRNGHNRFPMKQRHVELADRLRHKS